jgi:hypothetical protein
MPITSCNRRVKSLHSGGFKLLPSQEWFQTLTAPTISSGSGPSAIGPWYYLDDTLHLSTQISQDCKTLHIPCPNKPKLRPPLHKHHTFLIQIGQNCVHSWKHYTCQHRWVKIAKHYTFLVQISQNCVRYWKHLHLSFLIQIGQNCVHYWKHYTCQHK